MTRKQELEKALDELNGKIQTLEKELDTLADQQHDLKRKIADEERTIATTSLLESISQINTENSIRVKLHSDTKTTPIMDNFFSSNKTFLIFEDAFTLYAPPKWIDVSLVVIKGCSGVNRRYSGLTMTDLKKAKGSFIEEDSLVRLNPNNRKYPLYQELVAIIKRIQDGEVSNTMTFQEPCCLGGQTYSDQTGYGSEYCGEDLIYQGTQYGQTTAFLIIGVLIKKW